MNPVNATFGHIYHVNSDKADILKMKKEDPNSMFNLMLATRLSGIVDPESEDACKFQFEEPKPVEIKSSDVSLEDLKNENEAYLKLFEAWNDRGVKAYETFLSSFDSIQEGDYTLITVDRLKKVLGESVNKILSPDQLRDESSALIFVDIPHTKLGTHNGHSAFENVTMTDDNVVKTAVESTVEEWKGILGNSIKTIWKR